MKIFKRITAMLAAVLGLVILASCGGNASGVEAAMSYTSTMTTVTITIDFAANDNLTSGAAVPTVKQYSYDEDGNEVYDSQVNKITFDGSYTEAETTFTGLDSDTYYLFKLYITYDSSDELITSLKAKTSSTGSADSATEIATTDEFITKINEDVEGNFVLTADLDFTGVDLSESKLSSSNPFKGTFDGQGHTISNVTLYAQTNTALFNYTEEATIKNFTMDTVIGDFSSGRASAQIGAVVGTAIETVVEDITVNNVDIDIQGNTSAILRVGGVAGYASASTFVNVQATAIDINFTRMRQRVSVGLFAGLLDGNAVGTDDFTGLATGCSAAGSIKGVLYFISTSTTADAFVHAGGFSGDVSSPSLLTNCYADATIALTRSTATSYTNEFNLVVGGFVGTNHSGSLKITKCFALADITVSSGAEVTSETTTSDIEVLNENVLTEGGHHAFIGGFVGGLNQVFDEVTDCYYAAKTGAIAVYAATTREATSTEITQFEKQVSSPVLGSTATIKGVKFDVTEVPAYYTLVATEATVTSETDFTAADYYTLSGTVYSKASEYTEGKTYYTLVATEDTTVNASTSFTATAYYTYADGVYTKASSYTYTLTATYLVVDDTVAYTYNDSKVNNVAVYTAGSDLSAFDSFVSDFVSANVTA
ncbi:MAG: hypothetical protein K6A63_06170 [Acholeplasmatales bacterium]|nr:hypothetical protein [Acholeplasmatales bacterium]